MRRPAAAAAILYTLCAVITLFRTTGAEASIVFDFNTLPAGTLSVTGPDDIESYMEGIYLSDITVKLGARTQKARIESLPTGIYLGNSDGAPDRHSYPWAPYSHPNPKDTFLINRWDATSLLPGERDRIVIIFEDVPITSVEFDWEIFPVTISGASADITFKADGVTITPFFPYALSGPDKPLGDLGHFTYVFDHPVSMLEFIDWTDAPIGIDNLEVTKLPAPGSLVLLATGVGALSLVRRRRRRPPR